MMIDENSSGSDSDNCSNEDEQMLSETDIVPYCKDTIFIDLRGFRSNFGRFICKEFCLIDSDGSIYHKFIKSPFRKTILKYTHQLKVDYQEKYGHRIPYDYGGTNVIQLLADTSLKFNGGDKKILVRDKMVEHNLKYIYRNIFQFQDIITLKNLNQEVKPKALDLLPYCHFHNNLFGWSDGPCAMNIALRLRYIYALSQMQKNC